MIRKKELFSIRFHSRKEFEGKTEMKNKKFQQEESDNESEKLKIKLKRITGWSNVT